jgi:hypothetical protein
MPTKITEKWFTGEEVMDAYGLRQFELMELVSKKRLTAFDYRSRGPYLNKEQIEDIEQVGSLSGFRSYHEVYDHSEIYDDLPNCLFLKAHVESLANELGWSKKQVNNERESCGPLSGKEKQELGRLQREKEKWDDSIRAAVVAGLFCAGLKGQRIIRDQLWEALRQEGLDSIPDTTFDKIWKAVPEKFRHPGGRPPKRT